MLLIIVSFIDTLIKKECELIMTFIKKTCICILFLLITIFPFAFKVRAISTSDVSTSALVGTDWGTPFDVEIKEKYIYQEIDNTNVAVGSIRVKQSVYFCDDITGHHYYMILSESDVVVYPELLENYGSTIEQFDELEINMSYNANRYRIIDYLNKTAVGSTSYSAFGSLAVSTSGLDLGLSVSMSRENSDVTFTTLNDFANGSYNSIIDYKGELAGTFTFFDAVVLEDLDQGDYLGITINYQPAFVLVLYDVFYSPTTTPLYTSVYKSINSEKFLDDDLNSEFNELLSTVTSGTSEGNWQLDETHEWIFDMEYGGYVSVNEKVYYYNYLGEQYYLIVYYSESNPDITDKSYPYELEITTQGDTNSEIITWSPKSDISKTTHTAQFSMNTKQIGASFSNSYTLFDISTCDRTDRISNVFKIEYSYDSSITTSTINQFSAVIFKDMNADYKVSYTSNFHIKYRDKYGLFNWFTRYSEEDYSYTNFVYITESDDVAQMKLDSNLNLKVNQNIYVEKNTVKRLMINTISTGTIEIDAKLWNSNSTTILKVYDRYGSIVPVTYETGEKGSQSRILFDVVKNEKYYIEVSGYASGETDCILSVKFPNITARQYWNTNDSYNTDIAHNADYFRPLIITSYGAFTLLVETSYSPIPPFYLHDTVICVYDTFGNLVRYNDNHDTSLYSKITNLNIGYNQTLIIMLSSSVLDENSYIGYNLKVLK